MAYELIRTEKKDRAYVITINRPDKMNALNRQVLREIKEAVDSVQSDKDVTAIILTGAGEKAFAAGADIAEFAEFSEEEARKMSSDGHDTMNALERSGKPTIAAVNGFSLGGGCELAMACHIRIASENARFGQPEVNLGLPPGYAGTQRLAQLIGKGRALYHLLSTDTIKATQALEVGLVSNVVPISELMSTCLDLVKKLSTKSPMALASVIRCVNSMYDSMDGGMKTEIGEFAKAFETSDFKEGTTAFLEKRKADFGSNQA
jgi:enoyl-CoA hydratase